MIKLGNTTTILICSLTALSPYLSATESNSQSQDQNTIEVITVTAQKRAQNIQDVGVAVTAFSAQQIKSLGLLQIEKIGF